VTTEPGDSRGPRPERPLHLDPLAMLVVFVGGALGTLARYLLSLVIPPLPLAGPVGLLYRGIPLATLLVNVLGAFLLGLLLSAIARRGAESRRGRTIRLLVGTGFMGGFTTYSSLAVETIGLGSVHNAWYSAAYCLVTLIVGLGASLAGIALGSRISRPRASGSDAHEARP
jgi:CrcB protein